MKSFFKNLTKRVIACPSCGKRTRVPLKPGSVLLVTCPACDSKFEIKFENPYTSLKNSFKLPWQKQKGNQTPLQRYFPVLVGLSILLMFKSCFVTPDTKTQQHDYQKPNMQVEQAQNKVFNM
tara:strand:+ start:285 stop:650 length:366 start_codon:yes stop_codon:yes gene_type:complete